MISNTNVGPEPKPDNRATIPTSGMVKWIEPTAEEEMLAERYLKVNNRREYFDELQRAVTGITALMNSEMSAAEILQKAKMEVKKIESENQDVVREFLGDDVTEQMQKINHDLDDLAALVSGIEASLAGFSPMMGDDGGEPNKGAVQAKSEAA